MNTMSKLALAGAFGLTLAACAEEKPAEPPPPPPPAEPAKPEIPAYEPTGDMADLKKAAAEGITGDNAEAQAKALEDELNADVKALEAPAEGAAAPAAAE